MRNWTVVYDVIFGASLELVNFILEGCPYLFCRVVNNFEPPQRRKKVRNWVAAYDVAFGASWWLGGCVQGVLRPL